ncbi:MAG: outer membrane beta-barrel protein [Limimaricola sp.]|uniref:outer membrane protein n=1 Tax=Limimaricola sp. TaxID=2211665 RepID=UPI001E18D6CF|nr:outer membrane beta-barrel protein [Limimaricola sp.]MBI1416736.1 outer membrane beta-barrel protein [Limimaricola sp.]
MAKSRFILASALAAVMVAPAAFAGGMAPIVAPEPVAVPVMAPPSDWSGFYVGADVGTISASLAGVAQRYQIPDISGTLYGVHAGYMYDMGSIVVGGEGFYGKTTAEYMGYKLDSLTLLKLKVGYDAGQIMPYAVAGMGNYSITGPGFDATDNGTFYGLGANFRISDRLFANAEFLQHKISDFDGTGYDADLTSVTAGLSFKF